MARAGVLLPPLVVALSAGVWAAQSSTSPDIVADVRAAMADGGVTKGEQTLGAFRSAHGTTPEALEALCWLARGALTDKLFERASRWAEEAQTAAAAALRVPGSAGDPALLATVESAAEVNALSLVEQGGRSEAVYVLRKALDEYQATPIRDRLEATLALVTMEGQSAPALEAGVSIGSKPPRADGRRHAQLLFFWAHWCQDCKAESPALARIADKYRARGLEIVAPTRRYGYVEAGRPADPARELRHIVQVRDSHYPFMKKLPVPVADANYRAYGVAAVPMHVLVDSDGIVRLYQQGRMTEAELDAAIVSVLTVAPPSAPAWARRP